MCHHAQFKCMQGKALRTELHGQPRALLLLSATDGGLWHFYSLNCSWIYGLFSPTLSKWSDVDVMACAFNWEAEDLS